ncbi:MAG: lipoprotein [Hyphomicrobiales bacterium]
MTTTRLLVLLMITGLTLSACGIRGDLETPPDSGQNRDRFFILDPLI